ncbi:MAG: DUF2079 domain-containing protein [Acidimicrobiales bacterium]|nr:DUF2079 domain-containing protein [Acidimicrobiales bacterium]
MTEKKDSKLFKLGFAIIAIQGVAMMAWSFLIYNRGSLSWDSALYSQAAWMISHGHFFLFDTVAGFSFFGNHGEIIMWVLSWPALLIPASLWLLIVQVACVVGAEIMLLNWIGAKEYWKSNPKLSKSKVYILAALILAGNPWIFWSVAGDFHLESVALFFLIGACSSFDQGRYRNAFIFAGFELSCGVVGVLWLLGIGLTLLIVKDRLRVGLLTVGLSLIAFCGFYILGADQSLTIKDGYPYLGQGSSISKIFGIFTHLGDIASRIKQRLSDIFAQLGSAGVIGVLSPWGLVAPFLILLVNVSNDYRQGVFAFPGFQSLPVEFLLIYGFFDVLGKVGSMTLLHKMSLVVLGIIAIGYTLIWFPKIPTAWLDVSRASGGALSSAESMIPQGGEVIASQGIAGTLAERKYIYAMRSPGLFPVNQANLWIVVAPYAGIETESVSDTLSTLSYLATSANVTLRYSSSGIYLYEEHGLTPGESIFVGPDPSKKSVAEEPGWALESNIGQVDSQNGIPTSISSRGSLSGYVGYGAFIRSGPGDSLVAQVKLSDSGGVNVEMWDDSTNTLLAREQPSNNGIVQAALIQGVTPSANLPRVNSVLHGFGIWTVRAAPGPSGDLIEIRIYSNGSSPVTIYSVTWMNQR